MFPEDLCDPSWGRDQVLYSHNHRAGQAPAWRQVCPSLHGLRSARNGLMDRQTGRKTPGKLGDQTRTSWLSISGGWGESHDRSFLYHVGSKHSPTPQECALHTEQLQTRSHTPSLALRRL